MNPEIYSVREDATVSEIASLMLKGHSTGSSSPARIARSG